MEITMRSWHSAFIVAVAAAVLVLGASKLSAQSCGEVDAPACDGACGVREACVPNGNDGCVCMPTGNPGVPCGFLTGGPACHGFCPPLNEICIVGQGNECLCVPAWTPTPTPTSTPTPTNTRTQTPVSTNTPRPTSTPQGSACVADCNRDGRVTVEEIVRSVSIALGTSFLATCPEADANRDGSVTVEEIVRAVNNGLNGCPR